MSEIKFFDSTIDNKDVKGSCKHILYELKPEWKDKELCSEEFSKGYVNSMTCFYAKDDEDRKEALVVRVHGLSLEEFGVARNNEMIVQQLAHAVGAFPKLRAVFNNGVMYDYFPGRMVTYNDLINPDVIKRLTKVIYNFHHVDASKLSLVDHKGNEASMDQLNKASWSQMKDMIENMIPNEHPDKEKDGQFQEFRKEFSNEVLLHEYEYIEAILGEMDLPLSTLQHGDVHPGNILINDATQEVNLIDFEMTMISYPCQDLGRFLEMKVPLEILGITKTGEPDITEEVRQLWLRSYLEAKCDASGRSYDSITNDEMEMFDCEVKIFSIMCELEMIAFTGVPMDLGDKILDMFACLPHCKERYYAQKDDLVNLKNRYVELKKNTVS